MMRILAGLGISIATAVACFAGDKETIQTAPIRQPVQPTWTANFEEICPAMSE
jgi:hypothetical protein